MKPKFYRKVLRNGMTVLFEKRNIPVVSVSFAVRAGGINESTKEKGIYHFIEHMLYKGTSKRNWKQIAEEIEKNGGQLNGFSSETVTVFWCKMPSRHLKIALDVLSDVVSDPLFNEKELEKERKVIFEEIKMIKDNPRIYVFDEIQECLYDEPLGLTNIGTEKSLKSLDRKKLVSKFKEVYKPNNMVLSVVGDAEFSDIVNFAQKNFGIEKGKVGNFKVKLRNKVKIEKRKGIDQANLVFAYHIPLSGDEKSYAAKVLSGLMVGGLSSRLIIEIREKRNLAYSVGGESSINKDYAFNYVYAGTKKENMELVKKLILEEFEKVANSLDEKELKEIKEKLIGNYQISMEDSQDQMVNLLSYEINGNAKEFYEYEKNIRKVKLKDVKDLAKKVKKGYSFFALVPD